MGTPEIPLPKAIGNFISFFLNLSSEIISLKNTFSLLALGISIPTVFLPGIVATLVDTELVCLAISSAKLTIFETFIPGKEIQVALLGDKAIGAIELRPKENFMIMQQNIKNLQKLYM